jgi:hypothetical protein
LPNWATLHEELKKPGVTLTLLWQEYRAQHPHGYAYSQFVSAIASGGVGSSRRCVRCILPARSCLSISPASGHT